MSKGLLALPIALLAGCVSYHARPLHPVRSLARFEARTLSDPRLAAFIGANSPASGASTRPSAWNLRSLTLAAFYFQPDLRVARAKIAAADAAVRTAGQIPNPTLSVPASYALNLVESGLTFWTAGLQVDIPIETAGKRGYRIAQARAAGDAARVALAEGLWQVRSRVRAALLDHLLAKRDLELLRSEQAARSETVRLLERRLSAGQVSVVEVDLARTDLDTTALALVAAQGRVPRTLAVLASALGLPAAALQGVTFEFPHLDNPPAAVSVKAIRRIGLLNRLDLHRLLYEYAAAEQALQLEVARQYPDVHFGPGYTYEQGQNTISLGLGVELPVFNDNQGPIAQAEAHRKQIASQFLALQAQAIGQIEQAMAGYAGTLLELKAAGNLLSAQDKRVAFVERSVRVGEDDLLALASARVLRAIAKRARLDALRNAQAALGALEDAVQRPLNAIGAAVPAPPTSRGAGVTKGERQ